MCTLLAESPRPGRTRRALGALVMAAAALALAARPAAAQPTTVDQHVPFSFAALNPCTGEVFAGSGFTHLKVTITFVPNLHVSLEENIESAQGVTATGARYVVPAQLAYHTIIDSDFAPANGTTEEMVQFIRQAEDGSLILDDDFYLRVQMHFTVNSRGDTTVSFGDVTLTCK